MFSSMAVFLVMVSLVSPGAWAKAQPGQVAVELSVSPTQPQTGRPVTVTLRVLSTGGPMIVALPRVLPITATHSSTGDVVSAEATVVSPSVYTAQLTFPTSGIWRIVTPAFPGAAGNALDVTAADSSGPERGCELR